MENNKNIILVSVLVTIFLALLIFAHIGYSNRISRQELEDMKQSIVEAIKNNTPSSKPYSDEQIKDIIVNTIKNNPELILTTISDFYESKARKNNDENKVDLSSVKELLENNLNDPVIGTRDAPIKIVEFFDYSCKYCKNMLSVHNEILKNNSDVVLIFKELPIFGEESLLASKYALAVNLMDKTKYGQFQSELLNFSGEKNSENMLEIANNIGIDKEELQKFLESNLDKINIIIEENKNIAKTLNVKGTPSYFIGNVNIPGATSSENIQKIIDNIRSSNN